MPPQPITPPPADDADAPVTAAEAAAAPPSRANSALVQMGVDPSLVAMLDDSRRVHHELSQTALNETARLGDAREQVLVTPFTRPEVPDLPMAPKPPEQELPGNGLRVYGQFLPVLATLGGMFVQRDATAALRVGTAAMRAARANDQAELELQNQHWEQQMERIVSDRESMLQQYQAALSDSNLDLSQRTALLQALAAQENNIMMRTRISMGDLSGVAEMVNTQVRAVEALRTQMRADQALNETQRHNLAMEQRGGGRGAGTVSAEARGRIALTYDAAVGAAHYLDQADTESNNRGETVLGSHGFARAVEGIPIYGETWAGMLGDEDYQRYVSASSAFESAMLPILSGAAVTESEARRLIRATLPQLRDDYTTLQDKARRRRQMLNGAAAISGREIPFPDDQTMDLMSLGGGPAPGEGANNRRDAGRDIPQAAIDYLRANPSLADQFEEEYGLEPGDAQNYLQE